MAEASFFALCFGFQMTGRQIRRIVAPACENHNQFCVASPLVSRCGALLGHLGRVFNLQSPAGEETEISLL